MTDHPTSDRQERGSLGRWIAAAIDARMTCSGLRDALQRAEARIENLEIQLAAIQAERSASATVLRQFAAEGLRVFEGEGRDDQ